MTASFFMHDHWHLHSPCRGRKFTEANAFIGYQNDTPAAVVFQATRQLEGEGLAVSHQRSERTESVSDLAEEGVEHSQVWKESVSFLLCVLA